MKLLRSHWYSLLSIGFSVANVVFVYSALNGCYWKIPVVPHSEPYRIVLSVYGVLVIGSFSAGMLGATKERPQTLAILALGMAAVTFFVVGMSMAV